MSGPVIAAAVTSIAILGWSEAALLITAVFALLVWIVDHDWN